MIDHKDVPDVVGDALDEARLLDAMIEWIFASADLLTELSACRANSAQRSTLPRLPLDEMHDLLSLLPNEMAYMRRLVKHLEDARSSK